MTQVREIIGELETAIEDAVKRLSFEIVAELQESTPVDTGWARANWVTGLGAPGNSSTENSGDVGSANAVQQASLANIPGYRLSAGSVFITNNVPYITRLNEGSSTQAPAGFVQQAVSTASANLARQ